jgi:glycosyltransferase involved in cell wall biosynthesis
MRVLLIHQHYPGQFSNLARALGPKATIVAVGVGDRSPADLGPVRYRSHARNIGKRSSSGTPLGQLEQEIRNGRTCERQLLELKRAGFEPHVVIAHPGWGETVFLRDVYPDAASISYLEYFYRNSHSDVDFDPEFPAPWYALSAVRFRNLPSLLAFQDSDLCLTPTAWQASTFPAPIRKQLRILHDGIDTVAAAPNPSAVADIGQRTLSRSDEVITFVSRSLEPYRGFHILMRALPELLRRRPKAVVVIVGDDDVSYGAAAGPGATWRQRLLAEVGDSLDTSRVHFLGRIPYSSYLTLLQVSWVHVYLTYPFVLSWSLLEAMSAGCAIVASDTPPVAEVIVDGENGRLFPFFDKDRLTELIEELLEEPGQRERLGRAARGTVLERFDFQSRILPEYVQILEELTGVPISE